MQLTWIDLNTWLLELAGKRILIDPWLVDPLVFGFPWIFEAYHSQPPVYNPDTLPEIDLILISQGLADHCHQPTLEQLNRKIPVIASASAYKTLNRLGFEQVKIPSYWQTELVSQKLGITVVPGAQIQPGQTENGFIVQDQDQGLTLYYEPHQFQAEIGISERFPNIDIAIAPVIGQIFPVLGQVIMGPSQALELVKTLKPRIFLPTSLGEIRASGILPGLIRTIGSISDFETLLLQAGLPTQMLIPVQGQVLNLPVLT